MPISKPSKHQLLSAEVRLYRTPLSVSAPSLLTAGSDHAFQKLIFDLFTISARIERVRVHFASKAGISGPQYSVLRAVASLQANEGVAIGIVAEHLQVTSAFIAAQSSLLMQRGFLKKDEDISDRRISRLSLTLKGRQLVDEIVEGVRPINDIFFGQLERGEFKALSAIIAKLVDSSRDAIVQIASQNQQVLLATRDKGA
jgi:MarR family transcriptional regulator, organic hydroperoxide resistance regulator